MATNRFRFGLEQYNAPAANAEPPVVTVVNDEIDDHPWQRAAQPDIYNPSEYVQSDTAPPEPSAVDEEGYGECGQPQDAFVDDGNFYQTHGQNPYLERLKRGFFSYPLGAALILGLVVQKSPFAQHFNTATALCYPLLVAVYFHSFRDRGLTKPAIFSLMLLVISPAGIAFDNEWVSLLIIIASYPVCCLDNLRDLRDLQTKHGWFAGFCFGMMVMGLK